MVKYPPHHPLSIQLCACSLNVFLYITRLVTFCGKIPSPPSAIHPIVCSLTECIPLHNKVYHLVVRYPPCHPLSIQLCARSLNVFLYITRLVTLCGKTPSPPSAIHPVVCLIYIVSTCPFYLRYLKTRHHDTTDTTTHHDSLSKTILGGWG